MPHNINSMFYAGEKPWHSLGKKVSKNLTSAAAIKAAGLDWGVERIPLTVPNLEEGETPIPFPLKFLTRRMDNGQPLGVVGSHYRVMQNKDAFSFFDALVGEKAAMYHTAGALGRGERVWILAQLPGDIVVKGVDKIEKYLLLSNSHDGRTPVTVSLTPVRVVCQNTLTMALSKNEEKATFRHNTRMGTKVSEVRAHLGMVIDIFKQLSVKFDALASKPCTYPEFESFARDLKIFGDPDTQKEHSKAYKIIQDISDRFEHGKGNDQVKIAGTWWTAYNAVTEFVDYSPLFSRAKDADDRATSILFGKGSRLKSQALTAALEQVK